MDSNWDGRTYFGRPQLKPAPFNKYIVGGYVFLAGVSGKAQILGTLLDLTQGAAATVAVRRARLLALLAPTIGSVLLIADLHTPERFYNMFRVFKRTSPMSVGTWILTAFSGFSGIAALADFVPWLRRDRPRRAGAGGSGRRGSWHLYGVIVRLHQFAALGRGAAIPGGSVRGILGRHGRRGA